MSGSGRWWRFGLALLVTLALLTGMGAWRAAQHSAIAWQTIKVGESIEQHGLLVEAVSLAATELDAIPDAVWVELVVILTPTTEEGLTPSCDKVLRSGEAEWYSDSFINSYTETHATCSPREGEPPLAVGDSRQVHSYFQLPAKMVDQMSVKVEFYEPPWAVIIEP